jgi:hypothetical protein
VWVDLDGILGQLAEGAQVMRLYASATEPSVFVDGIDATHATSGPVDPFRRLREAWIAALRPQMPCEAAQLKTACGTLPASFWIRVDAQQQFEVGGHAGLGRSCQDHALRAHFRHRVRKRGKECAEERASVAAELVDVYADVSPIKEQ